MAGRFGQGRIDSEVEYIVGHAVSIEPGGVIQDCGIGKQQPPALFGIDEPGTQSQRLWNDGKSDRLTLIAANGEFGYAGGRTLHDADGIVVGDLAIFAVNLIGQF